MSIEFATEPVYAADDDDQYVKRKLKTYLDKVNTNVQGTKISEENVSYKCLLLIIRDSFIGINEKYQPQLFIDESKSMH